MSTVDLYKKTKVDDLLGNATSVADGSVTPAKVAAGGTTPDETKFWRGDGTWQVVGDGSSLPISLAAGPKLYVHPSGSDLFDGQSTRTPKASIPAAVTGLRSAPGPGFGTVELMSAQHPLTDTQIVYQGIAITGPAAVAAGAAASGGAEIVWNGPDDGRFAIKTSASDSTDYTWGQLRNFRLKCGPTAPGGGAYTQANGIHLRNVQNEAHFSDLFVTGFPGTIGAIYSDDTQATATNTMPGAVKFSRVWATGNKVNWRIRAGYTAVTFDMCKSDHTSMTTDAFIIDPPIGSSAGRGGKDGVFTFIGFTSEGSAVDANHFVLNTDIALVFVGGSGTRSTPGTKPFIQYNAVPASVNIPAGCIPVDVIGCHLQNFPALISAPNTSPPIYVGVATPGGGETTQVTWSGNPTAPAKWQGLHSGFAADQMMLSLADPAKVGMSVTPAAGQSADVAQWSANLIADAVTRADSTSTPGGGWTVASGTWGVASNQLYAVTAGGTMDAVLVQDAATANGTFRADIVLSSTASRGFSGLVLRYIDNSNYIRVMLKQSTGELLMQKMDGGSQSALVTVTPGFAAGGTYKLVATLNGTSIIVTVNGTPVINYTLTGGDATKFLAPSKIGLRVNAGSSPADDGGTRFDNVYFAAPAVRITAAGALQKLISGVWTDVSTGTATPVVSQTPDYMPHTFDPGLISNNNQIGTAVRYFRCKGSGAISKIGLIVGTQSGNISVAVYANNGSSGAAARPGTRLATSGSIACPAAGDQQISLGATVTMAPGDWIAVAADNGTATIRSVGSGAGVNSSMALGWVMSEGSVFPCPATPAPTTGLAGWPLVLVGAP